ncbi:uncharacterized protein Z519_06943 [Cladophialophora bantiana CBS 173.52]|uniref:CENP-V/GFA domain-containing protein n=1 Tax=Cladophialophora bantiana (strain ATCC 10958 / CBS 173.52 / CDC B-1940 / NIH 8579) TaxID=1442370 RepID=A0A0D2EPS8_CLAB1|nr:uncharacterized protein Z519_06943 [Cladophialophora bantiana CBS 173.52]KIW91961.1 hypothetical protein Z519_06943 [Cladophialophora bantiana CBS 173.52]
MSYTIPGGCYCGRIRYEITLDDPDKEARTSICHCGNCKKFTGGNFGITSKIPRSSFQITQGHDSVKVHEEGNGTGTILHREFCKECGSGLLEYGNIVSGASINAEYDQANAGDFVYVFYGTLDHPTDLPPKGEFFTSRRDSWMPEIPGLFQKKKIKE